MNETPRSGETVVLDARSTRVVNIDLAARRRRAHCWECGGSPVRHGRFFGIHWCEGRLRRWR